MVDVLVILDGASEPLRDGEPTSLELARTPALHRLAGDGEATRLRTIAPGLTPGSEAAIPALPGWVPPAPADRGALDATAVPCVTWSRARASLRRELDGVLATPASRRRLTERAVAHLPESVLASAAPALA